MSLDPLPRCDHCKEDLPIEVIRCKVCGRDAGYPNVRFCERPSEAAALATRYTDALAKAEAKGAAEKLSAFEKAVSASNAVLVLKKFRMMPFILSDAPIVSFYKAVAAGSASPANDEWDINRPRNDSSVNPYFHEDITCAALSLTDEGVSWYGEYDISLKSEYIDIRTTVFEENPFGFNKKPRATKDPPPPGHRAKWDERAKLAVSKLEERICADTCPTTFPAILLDPDHSKGDSDFIEVHIYGPVDPRAIAKVYAHPDADPASAAIWKVLKDKLLADGIAIRE